MKRFVILTVLVLVLPAVASAAFFEKVGTFAGQFMQIGTTARAAGMGAAYTAVADDAASVFWNPAGLVNVRGSEFQLSHVDWPADIKLTSAVLAFKPRQIPGSFAISVRSLWLDPMLVRTAYQPEGNGQTFDAGSTSFGFTYSRFFTDKFSSGFTLNYLHMGLAETAVNSASVGLRHPLSHRRAGAEARHGDPEPGRQGELRRSRGEAADDVQGRGQFQRAEPAGTSSCWLRRSSSIRPTRPSGRTSASSTT